MFLRVADGTETQAAAIKGKNAAAAAHAAANANANAAEEEDRPRESSSRQGKSLPSTRPFDKLSDDDVFGLFARHLYAMLLKRALYFKRDAKSWVFQYIVPALFVLVGVVIMVATAVKYEQPSKQLSGGMYNKGISSAHLPFPYADAPQVRLGYTHIVPVYFQCVYFVGVQLLDVDVLDEHELRQLCECQRTGAADEQRVPQ